ncbi:MAG: DUF58 domain-containing protein, partial [Spirochaetes bacterium]|nr:DUF58 domain-containing protein [Spirochaetota bacterium]
FIFSFIIFIISLFFKNLFLQFLSVSVLFIFDFLIIYYIAIFINYRKKSIDYFSLSDGMIHPFEDACIKIEAKNLPIPFPGIYFLLNFSINENNNKINTITSSIHFEEKDSFSLNIVFDRHGKFLLKNFKFIFRDIFGLTELSFVSNFEHSIVVYPYFIEAINIPFFLDKGGEEILQSVVKVDSTDFFENRKYYPGDDTRRINWNIFAHSNELHIREVEKIPPKIGQISILYAPFSKNLFEYEYITSLFLATVNYLLKYDFRLKIISPYNSKTCLIDKNSEKEFNNIINMSYRPFEHAVIQDFGKPIVFASFEEYNKIIDYGIIDKSFCAISFYGNNENKKDILKCLWNIDHFDNLFKEIINRFNNLKKQNYRENLLQRQKDISLQRNIQLELYRIGDEFNKIIK